MKKLILGCTLILCGVIGICAEYIKQAIYFASPDTIAAGTDYEYGIILLVVGILFTIWGFLQKGERK